MRRRRREELQGSSNPWKCSNPCPAPCRELGWNRTCRSHHLLQDVKNLFFLHRQRGAVQGSWAGFGAAPTLDAPAGRRSHLSLSGDTNLAFIIDALRVSGVSGLAELRYHHIFISNNSVYLLKSCLLQTGDFCRCILGEDSHFIWALIY